MFEAPFYFGTIRKTIVAFGNLFSDIKIERRKDDSVTGDIVQVLRVPLAYSNKEKWIVRIDSDPTLEHNVYTTLPRIAFEITGYAYDAQRKTNRIQKLSCNTSQSVAKSMFSPVPYNIQIIEQILPLFTPEYTLTINAVPDMNIIQDIPIILNNVSVMDEYEGDFQTRRFVTHTLDFTLKLNIYGPITSQGVITTLDANINNMNGSSIESYSVVANPTTGEIISEDWIAGL
jgi:hypothetical protein